MSQPLPKKVPDELINNKSLQVRDYFQRLTNGAYYLWEQTKNITGSGNVTTLTTNVGLLNTVKDLTSATEDYELSVNETAKIDISAASTDLNIALEDGVYEIDLEFDESTFAVDQSIALLPNGETHTNEVYSTALLTSTSIATDEVDVVGSLTQNIDAHRFSSGVTITPWNAKARLIINGTRSSMQAETFGTSGGDGYSLFVKTRWKTSALTSVTLSIGEAATGVCYVKRSA